MVKEDDEEKEDDKEKDDDKEKENMEEVGKDEEDDDEEVLNSLRQLQHVTFEKNHKFGERRSILIDGYQYR
jgi:hypothetical protein